MTAFSSSQPEAVELMRKSLKELYVYGLQGTLFDQYIVFWKRILAADFGPSISAFPTPVSRLLSGCAFGA
jgi:peptide/nickel transport system permease protein